MKLRDITWPAATLKKYSTDIFSSGTTYIIVALAFLLWRFALGYQFHWQNIEPFSTPSIFIQSFYSAFTFFTLGFLLYAARFYKVLHDILVKGMGLWGLYNAIKAIVWICLMFVSYEYIVPWLFDVLNAGTAVLFNVAEFVLYAFPPIGIGLIVSGIYLLIREKGARRGK